MEIQLDKAYKTTNDSLVLIIKKHEKFFEGIVIAKLDFGYSGSRKYRNFNKEGKVVNFNSKGELLVFCFGSKNKSNGWDIVKEIDKKEIDVVLMRSK